MPRMTDVYSKFIKADQLRTPSGGYGTMILTIQGSRIGEFDDGQKQIVCGFEEDERELGFNVTNAETMREITGSDNSDDWEGVKIELYVDPNVRFGKKIVAAVRVRKPAAGAGSAPSQPRTAPPASDAGGPPPDESPAADPLAAITNKSQAWGYFCPVLKRAGKTDDEIKTSWTTTVKGINKPEAQFTADDWRNVAEAADIPF